MIQAIEVKEGLEQLYDGSMVLDAASVSIISDDYTQGNTHCKNKICGRGWLSTL